MIRKFNRFFIDDFLGRMNLFRLFIYGTVRSHGGVGNLLTDDGGSVLTDDGGRVLLG